MILANTCIYTYNVGTVRGKRGGRYPPITMLVWSTQIPILPNRTTDDLLRLCRKWLVGSPHSIWKEEDIGEPTEGDQFVVENAGQTVSISTLRLAEESWLSFRHQWQEKEGFEWTTDICGWRTAERFITTIQLSCKTVDQYSRVPTPKKPYIVKQMLEELGGDLDGELPVVDTPILLLEGEVDKAARLVKGETENYFPVVYVSATWRDAPALDAVKLAKWASGMAHIIVEPSRQFSFQLALASHRTNPYDGAVAVCWPHGAGRQTRFFPYHYGSKDEFSSAVADLLRRALATRRPMRECTWDYISERIARCRIASLVEAGDAKVDAYMKAFDAELAAKSAMLELAENENRRLKSDLARINGSWRRDEESLLAPGEERELYSGEQRDVVLHALRIAKDHVVADGRVRHVIESLLQANAETGERERLDQGIRNALGKSEGLGTKEKRALEELGFSIDQDGKHLKLVFRGDDRYTFTMAKTGSDFRGMKNWISDTTKRLLR